MAYKVSDLSLVIPNWNGRVLLERHLPLVIQQTKGAEIIVVDDCSDDDSIEWLQRHAPEVRIIKTPKQSGFSTAVNTGVAQAKNPLLLLLNTDIEPESGFLTPILPLFEDETLFAVGLMDRSIEATKVTRGRGILWFERGFFVHKRGDTDQTSTDWVSGGSGLFRKSIWDKLGGMDERFNPFYWEDLDLSQRAVKAGYRLHFCAESVVIHKHDSGAIKTHYSQHQIKQIAFRNQVLFTWKHMTAKQWLSHVGWLPYHLVKPLIQRDTTFLRGFFQAFGVLICQK